MKDSTYNSSLGEQLLSRYNLQQRHLLERFVLKLSHDVVSEVPS